MGTGKSANKNRLSKILRAAPVTVAIQGERGAYSECAATAFFEDQKIDVVPCRDYSDLFRKVLYGDAACMAIPIENSTAGSVYPYYDLLLEYASKHDFRIVAEHKLKIRHNLICHASSELKDLREVRSHFQALDQCHHFIRRASLLPRPVYDTAGAAKQIAKTHSKRIAAVASVQVAADYGLRVLKRNIQDRNENYTRFLLVTADPDQNQNSLAGLPLVKTSIAFCLPNTPGALLAAFAMFRKGRTGRGADILRIESRPLTGTSSSWRKFVREPLQGSDTGVWDLLYYLDFSASLAEAAEILKRLSTVVVKSGESRALQLLGQYPIGPLLDRTGKPWR